jgi:hypothetical protein
LLSIKLTAEKGKKNLEMYLTIDQTVNMKVNDRIGDQSGSEWEPIKILHQNLAYVPNQTQHVSLLTRLRPHRY